MLFWDVSPPDGPKRGPVHLDSVDADGVEELGAKPDKLFLVEGLGENISDVVLGRSA